MISPQEWADWTRSPVTQAVVQKLTEHSNSLIEDLLNAKADTLEGFGIQHLAIRNQVNGLAEFLDLDSLKELCEVPNED